MGKITNWKDVGGKDQPIVAQVRRVTDLAADSLKGQASRLAEVVSQFRVG